MGHRLLIFLGLLSLLHACSSKHASLEPTIAELQDRTAQLEPQVSFDIEPQQVIESYQSLLEIATDSAYNSDISRRLADLELEASIDNKLSENIDQQQKGQQEAISAIEGYKTYLRQYPLRKDNDLILYQLSRAYSLESQNDLAQQALDQIALQYPQSQYIDEVQFRRGEHLFVLRSYAEAKNAYDVVVKQHVDSLFYEKALYKYGWTQFKLNRNRDALNSFVKLLDNNAKAGKVDSISLSKSLARADRELLDDVIRVVSLLFSYESSDMSIQDYFKQVGARHYEPMLYRSLAEFYLGKDRFADASDTYLTYGKRYPFSRYTPEFHQNTIDIYQRAGYNTQLLEQKIAYVNRYDVDTPFWNKQDQQTRIRLQPTLARHLRDLATHYHAQARLSSKSRDYQVAAGWYRRFLKSFPGDRDAAEVNFLLAESLFDAGQIASAINEYEKTAYHYPTHKNSAEAGYAALIGFASLAKLLPESEKKDLPRKRIDSALRFAEHFPTDRRVPAVLLQTAEHFFAEKQYQQATDLASRLTTNPQADQKIRQSAWTIIAHSQYATAQYALAENSYLTLLPFLPKKSKTTTDTRELVAASIYKQGEAARNSNNQLLAAQHFSRLGKLIPESPKRVVAEYDAATAYIELQDWPKSISLLEAFRKRYPEEKKLQSGVTEKLALAYNKNGNQAKAAGEMILLSANAPKVRKQELMWAAAGLYEEAGNRQQAVTVYKSYVREFPLPLDRSIELRHRIAEFYGAKKDQKTRSYWLKEIVSADARGKTQRTDRSRYLAATASMELIEPIHHSYQKAKLTIPLKKSLKIKKNLMQQSIDAYSKALKYQIAEVTTEATYHIAEIYHDFANALLQSQRPKGLDEEALEEYDLLLEEQAYPFEEKAIDIHFSNFKRIPEGIYDQSIKDSLKVLAKLLPFRYAREEVSSDFLEQSQ